MRKPKILHVEDHPIIADNVARYLEAHGYEVHRAATLKEATRLMGEATPVGGPNSFDLVIADGDLPDGDSVAFVMDWQAVGQPVMMYSGNADYRRPGMLFLAKPATLAKLEAVAAVLINLLSRKDRQA